MRVEVTVDAIASQLNPMFGEIERHPQFEGSALGVDRYDGSTQRNELRRVSAEISVDKDVDISTFLEKKRGELLKELGMQKARAVQELINDALHEATEATGNVVEAGGGPFTPELMLQSIDKMEHDFAKDGTWRAPTFFTGPGVYEKFVSTYGAEAESNEFRRKLEEILSRKRDEFRRREASRVLAG